MTFKPSSLGSTTQNWIGRSQFAGDPYFNGKVDEFYIYDRALTATEIQALMNNIPPAAPTGLGATGGNLVVNLNWTQSTSSGITGNNVYRSTTGSSGPYNVLTNLGATTAYSDTAVTGGSTYYYTVTAVNSSGESAMSAYAGATPTGSTPPAAPTSLTASSPQKRKITLNWTQSGSPNISSNKVYRATVNGGPYTLRTTIPAATTYSETGLTSGATYYYVVTAVNSSSVESSYSAQASAVAR
jgi:cellulose 1,4-beta-cellobiosidase